jgi:dTDP-4-dehydrorhamnose 3,5-epimerase
MRVGAMEGVGLYEARSAVDERGTTTELRNPGFVSRYVMPQWNPARFCVVHNRRSLTLRGLHYQVLNAASRSEYGTHKIVVCTSGIVFDVLIDLRPDSKTHLQWMAVSLSPGGGGLCVPPGIAHGYMTLTPQSSLAYILEGERHDDLGVRWDDPKIGVEWPADPAVISERDRAWELL